MVRTAWFVVAWSTLALVASACGAEPARPTPFPSTDGSPATVVAGPSGSSDVQALPLDAASRDLLAVMDPTETAHVVVGTTWTDELSRAALQAGMRVEVFEPGVSIAIDGPVGAVVALAETVPLTGFTVQDSMEAMRPILDARPTVTVPAPGRPYVVVGFSTDLSKVVIPSPQRESMLRTLAATIQTIDGRPYAQLQLEGSCGADKSGPSCGLAAVGLASGSPGEDDWSIRATARTGLAGAIEGIWTTSVPRPLIRAAEWYARHDAAALPRIRRYETFGGATWDPARPGQVTLVYTRLCATTLVSGRDLAETGVCEDDLSITVDLRAGVVVAIVPPVDG